MIEASKNSNITHKHSAMILCSGKPIIIAKNSIRGNNSCHAEYEALYRYLILHGQRRREKENSSKK